MAIVRYNPFRELRTMQEQMNRLLDLAWSKEGGEELKEGIGSLRWTFTKTRIPWSSRLRCPI